MSIGGTVLKIYSVCSNQLNVSNLSFKFLQNYQIELDTVRDHFYINFPIPRCLCGVSASQQLWPELWWAFGTPTPSRLRIATSQRTTRRNNTMSLVKADVTIVPQNEYHSLSYIAMGIFFIPGTNYNWLKGNIGFERTQLACPIE